MLSERGDIMKMVRTVVHFIEHLPYIGLWVKGFT